MNQSKSKKQHQRYATSLTIHQTPAQICTHEARGKRRKRELYSLGTIRVPTNLQDSFAHPYFDEVAFYFTSVNIIGRHSVLTFESQRYTTTSLPTTVKMDYTEAPPATGNRGACYNCGDTTHQARDCPTKQAPSCYNCGQQGHMSRECTEPAKDKACYNCGETGHLSRECPTGGQQGRSGGFGGASGGQECYKCGKVGHIARNCDQEGGSYGGGFGAEVGAGEERLKEWVGYGRRFTTYHGSRVVLSRRTSLQSRDGISLLLLPSQVAEDVFPQMFLASRVNATLGGSLGEKDI
nr:cellular nucleic acid-binding protein like [Quercus suber]